MTQVKEKPEKKRWEAIGKGRLAGLLAWPAFAILFRNHVWAFWGGLAISECVCYSIGYIIWRIRLHREFPLPLLLRKDLLSIGYAATVALSAFFFRNAYAADMMCDLNLIFCAVFTTLIETATSAETIKNYMLKHKGAEYHA